MTDEHRKLASREFCSGCSACMTACRQGAISMKADSFGFEYPRIQKKLCINCGACSNVCPQTDLFFQDNKDTIMHKAEEKYFGARLTDIVKRLRSSSGAVFFALAESILERGGCVISACMERGGYVHHILIDDSSDIGKLSKTKYVQSNTDYIYNIAKDILTSGRRLMFVGTPCQVEAMRKTAGKMVSQLLLVDLVCYGVPSPKIWEDYVHILEKKYHGKMDCFYFRDKRNRDDGHTAVAVIDGQEYAYPLYEDRFCYTYFKNINIRESCLHCKYTTPDRRSDITIGDFWGIEKVMPGFSDGQGSSLVITHNNKGLAMWEDIKANFEWFECSREDVLQPRLLSPTVPNSKRKRYMRLFSLLPSKIWFKLICKTKL